ncbi:hypothetical protein ACIPSE_46025 [Streptomyces sp. NPDC090106]|uniref:hypothetical protein n=1 Tax=Streptomyces sp. NPDC090106 TaxID=3365946 RepID=UPI0037F2F016
MADVALQFLANFTAGLALTATTLAWRWLRTRRTPRAPHHQNDGTSPDAGTDPD